MYVDIFIYIYTHMSIILSACLCLGALCAVQYVISICVYASLHVYTCICTYVSIYICVYICRYVCVHRYL